MSCKKRHPDRSSTTAETRQAPERLSRYRRIAVFGGDGRHRGRFPTESAVEVFAARRYSGNGTVERLYITVSNYDLVIILARWNDHSSTVQIRRRCRALGVPVEIWP